jgi:hypothetical protein
MFRARRSQELGNQLRSASPRMIGHGETAPNIPPLRYREREPQRMGAEHRIWRAALKKYCSIEVPSMRSIWRHVNPGLPDHPPPEEGHDAASRALFTTR